MCTHVDAYGCMWTHARLRWAACRWPTCSRATCALARHAASAARQTPLTAAFERKPLTCALAHVCKVDVRLCQRSVHVKDNLQTHVRVHACMHACQRSPVNARAHACLHACIGEERCALSLQLPSTQQRLKKKDSAAMCQEPPSAP
eukprot:366253-Chlamydomonas_euryale.AAC.9